MSRKKLSLSRVWLAGLFLLLGTRNSNAQTIAATEAKNHIGETTTVCGEVVSARVSKYAVTSRGRPTFLDLDKSEPDPAFLIVMWGEDKAKPGETGTTYKGKRVCVTGKIIKTRGVPQIIASKPSQVKIQSDEKK